MAVAFKGIGTQAIIDDAGGTAHPCAFSTNVEGDFLLACCAASNGVPSTDPAETWAAETDWTLITLNVWASATAGNTQFYYRFAPAGGISSQTFDTSGTTGSVTVGLVFTGVDVTTPIDVGPNMQQHTTGTISSRSPPDYTTTVDDCMGIISMNRDGAPVTITFPSGYTDRIQSGDGGPGDGLINCIGTQLHASAGAQAPGDFTWTTAQEACSMSFALRNANPIPVITDVETDEDFDDADTALTITGTVFEAAQGTGKVEISDNATYATGTKITQTITSWADTAIDFTASLSTLTPGALWLWVTNDTDDRNTVGFVVTVHRAKAFGMAASANITASGENTTFQLTAPAGKTTGDFGGGRIQDDENPGDTVDIAEDEYREDEWSIEALAASEYTEQYAFRVLIGGVVQGTISQTPKITVTAAVGGATPIVLPKLHSFAVQRAANY